MCGVSLSMCDCSWWMEGLCWLLQEVILDYNSLDQSSALAVAQALANKTELKTIDLNGQSQPPQIRTPRPFFEVPLRVKV